MSNMYAQYSVKSSVHSVHFMSINLVLFNPNHGFYVFLILSTLNFSTVESGTVYYMIHGTHTEAIHLAS